jgi:hypothetical protein
VKLAETFGTKVINASDANETFAGALAKTSDKGADDILITASSCEGKCVFPGSIQ